ncbi:HD domain-containing protein [Anabaena sp. FACHB-1237]|uniref:HD domain-containing protein n=1 Tax=Anabaena sp. FACHB-1237 TaxID=2692769 RepID=UPI001680D9B0|nr:HD domain-containing protein [Anabaena sp. FACHB-1237]MBD2137051.1 HD domain-containing protein [Anabaena sp. FACHB-1237]
MVAEKVATKLTERFEKAVVYAIQLHSLQVRKQRDIPYATHLLSVSSLVLEDEGDEDEAIAALLHDAIEDQGGLETRKVILEYFGERVTAIIDGCTEEIVKHQSHWRDRKLNYLEKIRTGSTSSRRVALADKLHNSRSILMDKRQKGDVIWDKFGGQRSGTLWFYRAFLDIYKADNFPSILVAELEQVILELEK